MQTLRNRRFLRVYTPETSFVHLQQPATSPLPATSVDQTKTPQQSVVPEPQARDQIPSTDVAPERTPMDEVAQDRPPIGDSPPSVLSQEDDNMPGPEPTDTRPQETTISRPQPATRPPKHYEPETGPWIG